MFNFLNNVRKGYIYTIIKKILPNLNESEFQFLIDKLCILIEYIATRFSIIDYDMFWNQLKQNNNKDVLAMFNTLIPFINDKLGTYELHHQIYSLSDISMKKNEDSTSFDKSKNNYLVTNMQFNMYDKKEIPYSTEHVTHNFNLLLHTIDTVSNKLYVNWLNIVPMTLSNYKISNLYKNSITYNTKTDEVDTINIEFIDNERIITKKEVKLPRHFYSYSLDSNDEDQLGNEFDSYNKNTKSLDLTRLFKYKGISLSDVFNTLYYDLFLDVVKIKWLIYQDTFEDPNVDEIYIKKFNELIAIDGMYKNTKWNELDTTEQNKFISKWNSFLGIILLNDDKRRNSYYYLLHSIIIFMERNYTKMNAIVKKFNYEKLTGKSSLEYIDDDDGVNKQDDEVKMNAGELTNRIKVIPNENIYEYLMETIQKFIPTWYGRNIILFYDPLNVEHYKGLQYDGFDNMKFNYESYIETEINKDEILKDLDIDLPEDITIKYKFFYNYAKAIFLDYNTVHDGKQIPQIRQRFSTSTHDDRQNMIYILNLTYNQALRHNASNDDIHMHVNMMSFKNYYRKRYMNTGTPIFNEPSYGEDKQNKKYIHNLGLYIGSICIQEIRRRIIDITFETHIMKGLLTDFKMIPEITDNKFLGDSFEEKIKNRYTNLKKYVFTDNNIRDYGQNAFYYLTNASYGEMNEIHRASKKSYFELLMSDYKWFTFYSMDWVSQLNFFHKYINNRVIYVTGATGQGKSTQVPKLFLYGLKMIDRKMDGKIICSQPRIAPTRDNSEQISYELGVPITEITKDTKKKIKTFYPYIQYKTQYDSHQVENHYGLMLQLVTDRLLYMKLLESPIFKEIEKTYDENDKISNGVEFNVYSDNNMYDIIMVDESHEHNMNMDLILTIARDAIKYNNSLKLVIVSATMLDDEPIYRRYYKEINDNFAYPYNFYNSESNFERGSVDRRFDITPPGESTQHRITEIYLTKEPKDVQEAQDLGTQQVMKLATDPNSKGDILFFSLGEADTKKICEQINRELPPTSNIICLPFHSKIPPEWQFFNDLTRKLKQIDINREDLFDAIHPNPNRIPRKVTAGTYKRAIIVATNIAEASITINSLKYVVDIGYYISVSHNPYSFEADVERKQISESSRIQRKGRVGRVSSGTVYYMYTKDSRKDIKSDYKICQEPIAFELYDLSIRSPYDESFMNIRQCDKIIYVDIHGDNFLDVIGNDHKYMVKSKLLTNLIYKQYTYKGSILPSIIGLFYRDNAVNLTVERLSRSVDDYNTGVYMFDKERTINLIPDRVVRQVSGYDYHKCIYDVDGRFYIVHPEEKNITRNILTGGIISVLRNNKKSKTGHIISKKIDIYLKKCFSIGLYIDENIEPMNEKIFYDNDAIMFSQREFKYSKSTFGRIVQQIIANIGLKLDDDQFINRSIMMTLIYAYVCGVEDIIIVMIMLLNASKYKLSNLNRDYKMFEHLYNDRGKSSDLYIYYNLACIVNIGLKKINNKSIERTTYQFNKDKNIYLEQKRKILYDLNKDQNYWILDMNIKKYERFNTLSNQNKLDSKRNIYDYMIESNKIDDEYVNKLFSDILSSVSINFDANVISRAYRYYSDLKTTFDKLKNVTNDQSMTNNLQWFKDCLPVRTSQDEWINVKKSFMYGFGGSQIVYYNQKNNIIVDASKFDKIYKVSDDTITTFSKMMVYLHKEMMEISILIDTDMDTLVECNLYGFNPMNVNILPLYDLPKDDDITNSILTEMFNIHKNKYKYISYLKSFKPVRKSCDKLYCLPNDLTEYLIKLWTTDIKSNIYYKKSMRDEYKQKGGNLIYKIKVELNKIPYVLKQMNMTLNDLHSILYNYQTTIKNNHLYIHS
jgi:hypothetical protein